MRFRSRKRERVVSALVLGALLLALAGAHHDAAAHAYRVAPYSGSGPAIDHDRCGGNDTGLLFSHSEQCAKCRFLEDATAPLADVELESIAPGESVRIDCAVARDLRARALHASSPRGPPSVANR